MSVGCVCVHACVHMRVCTCVCGGQSLTSCMLLSHSLPYLLRQGHLLNPVLINRLNRQSVNSGESPVSMHPVRGLQICETAACSLPEYWASELGTSSLHSRHWAKWAISPAPMFYLCFTPIVMCSLTCINNVGTCILLLKTSVKRQDSGVSFDQHSTTPTSPEAITIDSTGYIHAGGCL